MGGFTKVDSKIGQGTKFIINTKVKCRRVANMNSLFDMEIFDSARSDKVNETFVFLSKDCSETELKKFIKQDNQRSQKPLALMKRYNSDKNLRLEKDHDKMMHQLKKLEKKIEDDSNDCEK